MTTYLQYWKYPQFTQEAEISHVVEHSASDQLNRVAVGDVVWIVTIRNGELFVVGKIIVGEKLKLAQAKKIYPDVYVAKYHIIAKPGTEGYLNEISIQSIARKLRFISSSGRDRLTLVNNRVDGKQFQTLRKATEETNNLIEFVWRKNNPLNKSDKIILQKSQPLDLTDYKDKLYPRTRKSSEFEQQKEAYEYILAERSARTVIPAHHNYQHDLTVYLKSKGIKAKFEENFIDVQFELGKTRFFGEIKVTTNITVNQAFRAALGQILEYAHLYLPRSTRKIMFLDSMIDDKRLELATLQQISVVVKQDNSYILLNSQINGVLKQIFTDR